MYRLNVPRAVRSRSPSPSRSAGRSASPARTASPARSIHSQYARNAVQAPIIPRYRGDTVEPMKLSAIMDQAIPVVAPTSVQPGMGSPMGAPATVTPMTKTPIGAPTTATPITKTPIAAPRTRSPRTKSPVGAPAVATPATAIGTSTSTPKSPVTTPLTKSPIGAPDMGFAFNPVGSTTRKPRSRTPKTPVAPKSPIQQPIPAHIPMNRTPITPPTAVAAPAALTTPFPLPHFTQPTAVTIPPTSTTPFPLPHFTQPIMTPHIPTPAPGGVTYNPTTGLPIGLPMTGLPAGYTYNPTTGMPMPGSQYTPATTGIPSGGYGGYGYGRSGPESNPLWPWITGTAIGTAIGLGIVSHQDKQKSQAPSMPIITWAPTDAGMGTKSVLIEEEHIEQMQTVVVPMMKRIFDFVFSWVGLGTTFVLLCFVEVLRQKLFGATAGETWTYGSSSDGSSMPIVTFADPIAIETSTGPVHIPPLDLATARVTLDRTAKTYVEQLIQYYEALAVETGRESLSERTKSVD